MRQLDDPFRPQKYDYQIQKDTLATNQGFFQLGTNGKTIVGHEIYLPESPGITEDDLTGKDPKCKMVDIHKKRALISLVIILAASIIIPVVILFKQEIYVAFTGSSLSQEVVNDVSSSSKLSPPSLATNKVSHTTMSYSHKTSISSEIASSENKPLSKLVTSLTSTSLLLSNTPSHLSSPKTSSVSLLSNSTTDASSPPTRLNKSTSIVTTLSPYISKSTLTSTVSTTSPPTSVVSSTLSTPVPSSSASATLSSLSTPKPSVPRLRTPSASPSLSAAFTSSLITTTLLTPSVTKILSLRPRVSTTPPASASTSPATSLLPTPFKTLSLRSRTSPSVSFTSPLEMSISPLPTTTKTPLLQSRNTLSVALTLPSPTTTTTSSTKSRTSSSDALTSLLEMSISQSSTTTKIPSTRSRTSLLAITSSSAKTSPQFSSTSSTLVTSTPSNLLTKVSTHSTSALLHLNSSKVSLPNTTSQATPSASTSSPSDNTTTTKYVTTSITTLRSSPFKPPTTTSPTTTSGPKTEIRVFGSETLVDYGTASVICGIVNPFNWTSIVLNHNGVNNEKRTIFTFDNGQKPMLGNAINPNVVSVSWKVGSSNVDILVAFKPARCSDVGLYTCSLIGRLKNISSAASVTVKAKPSLPVLTVPEVMVAGQQYDIQCSGSVGFPGGVMSLFIQDKNSGTLREATEQDGLQRTSRRDNCNNIIHTSYSFMQISSGNRISFLCMTENSFVATETIRQNASANLNMLPGSTCKGSYSHSMLTYPYACDKFIICKHGNVTIAVCPEGTCYDSDIIGCVSPQTKPDVELSMTSSKVVIGESATLVTCSASRISDHFILTLSHQSHDGTFKSLLTMMPNSTITTMELIQRNLRFAIYDDVAYMNVSIDTRSTSCPDGGVYQCLYEGQDRQMNVYAQVEIHAPPTKPKLVLSGMVKAGEPLRARCEGEVGYPGGEMQWYIKPPSSPVFIKFSIGQDEKYMQNCANYIVSTFVYTPTIAINGSNLRCSASNQFFPSLSHDLLTDEIQLVLS